MMKVNIFCNCVDKKIEQINIEVTDHGARFTCKDCKDEVFLKDVGKK